MYLARRPHFTTGVFWMEIWQTNRFNFSIGLKINSCVDLDRCVAVWNFYWKHSNFDIPLLQTFLHCVFKILIRSGMWKVLCFMSKNDKYIVMQVENETIWAIFTLFALRNQLLIYEFFLLTLTCAQDKKSSSMISGLRRLMDGFFLKKVLSTPHYLKLFSYFSAQRRCLGILNYVGKRSAR